MTKKLLPPPLLVLLGLLFSVVNSVNATTYTNEAVKVVFAMSDNANPSAYTTTLKNVFSEVKFDKGVCTIDASKNAEIWNTDGASTGIKGLTIRPKSTDNSDKLNWFICPIDGYTFTPTKVSGYVNRDGTDVEKGITITVHKTNGDEITLGTYTAWRMSKTSSSQKYDKTAIYHYEIELTADQQKALANTDGFYLSSTVGVKATNKAGIFGEVTIEGSIDGTQAAQRYNKPTFTEGAYNASTKTYSLTISSEEGTTIKYTVGEGEEMTSTNNTVTIDVAPSTTVTAIATGGDYVDSNQASFTTSAMPSVAAPTLAIGSYDYAKKGYAVIANCADADATLTYTTGGEETNSCVNGEAFYVVNTTLAVNAAKDGYTSSTSGDVTINDAPDEDNSRPFTTSTDNYDKNVDHKYISYTIPGTYIAGINMEKNGIKFRSNRASVTKIGDATIANALEIKVNEGYVIDQLNLKDFIANREDGTITISKVYVDGVEKTFAELGRKDESIEIKSAKSKEYTGIKSFLNLNASESIIIELTNGTYGSNKATVDQFRATIQTVYHHAPVTMTLGQNGYSTFASDYNYTFTGAKAYKATYNEASSNVTLTEVEGVVPANAAVIFKGTEGEEVTITESKEEAAELADNSLVGVTSSTTDFLAGTNYVLASNGTETAFVKMADGKKVADMIGKAYLNLPATAATKAVLFLDNNVTGINTVSNDNAAENNTLYNIVGQRVTKNAKGIIIVNGKAYINK